MSKIPLCGVHQYAVDIFAKFKKNVYINQERRPFEEYIHLRDAIVNDDNVNNFGRIKILPPGVVQLVGALVWLVLFAIYPRFKSRRWQQVDTKNIVVLVNLVKILNL